MNQKEKKRSPTNNQIKRPATARVESRETKLQQEKANRTPRSKEPIKKVFSANKNSNIAVVNRNKKTSPYEVHNKPSTDLYKEPNEESDSDMMTDSLSSSGDSRATEDEKVGPTFSDEHTINSKDFKVHPKPPSISSSISSEGFDGQEQDHGELKESDDETLDVEENNEDEEKVALNLKISQMEMTIMQLEDELREVAAFEISLYSVVQEHGNMVHAHAHRLSKLYIHTNKHSPKEKHSAISRNIVSGLVMISNSCGNDVPRLTFWWSNIVVLREIFSQAFEQQETKTFTSELEKVESEIFSRIIESIWSQTLSPNMLKNGTTVNILVDHQQSNFSINIWLNAFHEAFNKLCPVRAQDHECSCVPQSGRMVMEQYVARLDVSMFNAILNESTDKIPTGSITDSRILPIPAGDLSFGSGAQLKKAVGSWSRWLTDRLTMESDEQKWFNLLNSLSHLLMVPKDMLIDKSIRAEVCPSISLPLIKRIITNFTPDEFCPDPVPTSVLEAINAECIIESGLSQDNSSNFPCSFATIIYKPPSIIEKVFEEEIKYPDLIVEKSPTNRNIATYAGSKVRYELVRDVWSS